MPLHLTVSDLSALPATSFAGNVTISNPYTLTLSAIPASRVLFTGASGLVESASSITFTSGTGQLALSTTGSGGGILIGGDAQWYRGATDRLETTDDIYLNSATKGFSVGATPQANSAVYASRSTSNNASTRTIYGLLELTGSISGFYPYALYGATTINAGANTLSWAGGLYGSCRDINTGTQSGTITKMFGFGSDVYKYGTSNVTTMQGFAGVVQFVTGSTGTITTLTGLDATVDENSGATATVTTGRGIYVNTQKNGSGNWTNYYGIDLYGDLTGGTGTITGFHGIRVREPGGTGPTITTQYGIRIGDISKGSTNYALYFDGTSGLSRQGIWWNGDTNLYRSAADTLKTDDSLYVTTNLRTDGLMSCGTAANSTYPFYIYKQNSGGTTQQTIRSEQEITATNTGFPAGINGRMTLNAGSGTIGYSTGLIASNRDTASQSGTISSQYGLDFDCWKSGSGNTTMFVGGNALVTIRANSGGTVSHQEGFRAAIDTSAGTTAAVTNQRGFHVVATHAGTGAVTTHTGFEWTADFASGAGTVTTARGLRLNNPTSTGAITTLYGLHIADLTKGSTNYALYFDGTSGLSRQGIWWNGDTNLYRSAADTLKTDDSLHVGATFRHLGSSLGFYNATAVSQSTGWTTFTNLTTDKTCDANATTVEELADILGTLVEALKSVGLLAA